MTTEALVSNVITNRDATPRVMNNPSLDQAFLRETIANVTTTSGVTLGSTYHMVRVPSTARVSQILLSAAAMTQGAFDVGVYRTTGDGSAVVDQDFFATAVDCSSAVKQSDVTNESGTYTIAKQAQPLWQAAGMSSDPGGDLDIVCTNTNTITAGAALQLQVRYVV